MIIYYMQGPQSQTSLFDFLEELPIPGNTDVCGGDKSSPVLGSGEALGGERTSVADNIGATSKTSFSSSSKSVDLADYLLKASSVQEHRHNDNLWKAADDRSTCGGEEEEEEEDNRWIMNLSEAELLQMETEEEVKEEEEEI